MTVKECYELMESDYEGVLKRLMTDARIQKYLTKFLNETSMQDIRESLGSENYEEAFRNAHNLKGVCMNLGLSKLFESSDILCETLRNGKPTVDIAPLLEAVEKSYEQTIAAIKQL